MTTITLDLDKELAAQNAAHTYLRARTGESGSVAPWLLAKEVAEVARNPEPTETYTMTWEGLRVFANGPAHIRGNISPGCVTLAEFEQELEEAGFEVLAILVKKHG